MPRRADERSDATNVLPAAMSSNDVSKEFTKQRNTMSACTPPLPPRARVTPVDRPRVNGAVADIDSEFDVGNVVDVVGDSARNVDVASVVDVDSGANTAPGDVGRCCFVDVVVADVVDVVVVADECTPWTAGCRGAPRGDTADERGDAMASAVTIGGSGVVIAR